MHLLQINATANWGSTGKIAEQINQVAQAHGWKTYIAYGRYARACQSEVLRVGGQMDIIRHGIQSLLFDRQGLASQSATKQFIEEIDKIRPDVIHLHNIHGYYINYQILFSYLKRAHIPVVWTLHDCWPFTGHCSHFVTVGCERWKTECHDCPIKSSEYPKSWLFDRSRENYRLKKETFNGVDNLVIVPVSEWISGLVKESFLGGYPIKCIHNGIDLRQFVQMGGREENCKKWGIDSKKKIILGVASVWESRKGLNDFNTLCTLLGDDFQIVLVGITEKQRNKLPPQIKGILRTNNVSELAELYSAADVYVNPTYADTFPTTNLESLACGTPIVTYRTGGSPEAIDEKTGVVVDQGDISGLVAAIKSVCEWVGENVSVECRRKAEKEFNKEVQFAKYFDIYETIVRN